MATDITPLLILLQSDNPEPDWWTSVSVGEWVGKDWLWLLGGLLFFSVVGYFIYSAMLYNQVGANRHPANFRRLIISLVLLLSVVWFGYVFAHAFGALMLAILLAVWFSVVIIFIFTRRKSALPQG